MTMVMNDQEKIKSLVFLMPSELSNVSSQFSSTSNTSNIITLSFEENKALYKNYRQLEMIYAGLCMAQQNCDHVIEEAYFLALLLQYIYATLLQCSQDGKKYRTDVEAFHRLLEHQYENCLVKPENFVIEVDQVTQKNLSEKMNEFDVFFSEKMLFFIKMTMGLNYFRTVFFVNSNWFRLYIVRWNRFFTDLALLFHNPITQFLAVLFDKIYKTLGLSILSFVFYVPRLLVNFFILAKHVIPNRWMTPEEKALGVRLRFQIQWERRCFQIKNDAVWFGTDLLVYFTVHSLGMMFISALYVFDVINTVLDMVTVYNIKKSIESRLNGDDQKIISPELSEGIREYLRQKMREKIFSSSVAIVLMIAMIPVMSIFPQIIPVLLVGAALVVITTTLQMAYQKKFNAKKISIASIDSEKIKKLSSQDTMTEKLPIILQELPKRSPVGPRKYSPRFSLKNFFNNKKIPLEGFKDPDLQLGNAFCLET